MRRLLRRIGNRLRPARPQPLILMYHRVAAPTVDPWGLAVHPDRFAAHMEVLRKHRTPLAMSEIVRRLQDGTLPDNAVARNVRRWLRGQRIRCATAARGGRRAGDDLLGR